MRLEEDLQGAPREAGIDGHTCPFGLGEARLTGGQDPQEQRLAVLQGAEGGHPHRLLGALAPDETLDGPVGQHDGVIAGPGRGGRLGTHHGGVDEGHPFAAQLGRPSCHPMGHVAGAHIGGGGRPCMASQTRDGVRGMSAWRMPNGFRASTTALTMAGGEPTVADSPTPLAPMGWWGDGVTV